jgi:hypothetical protein
MGQLTASIAREVNQPIAGSITNAQAALRWLDRPAPGLEMARQALGRIVRDGARAGAVVGRIRDLIGGRRHAGEPPTHLKRWLLIRVLAYRLRADAFGGLDKSIERMLAFKKEQGAAVPFYRRAPQTRDGVRLNAVALLAREWQGKLERVMILDEGFALNGQTFKSLSQIARAMTGTNCDGHRFFGLRPGKTVAADEASDRRKRKGTTAATAGRGGPSGEAPR